MTRFYNEIDQAIEVKKGSLTPEESNAVVNDLIKSVWKTGTGLFNSGYEQQPAYLFDDDNYTGDYVSQRLSEMRVDDIRFMKSQWPNASKLEIERKWTLFQASPRYQDYLKEKE